MAITINGSGTISGITAGGLPDGVITADDLAAGVGGKVLQVVSTLKNDTFSTGSLTYTLVTGLTASITPTSASSKILLIVNLALGTTVTDLTHWRMYKDGATLFQSTGASNTNGVGAFYTDSGSSAQNAIVGTGITYLDSPATTSSTTYQVYVRTTGGIAYINRRGVAFDFGMCSSITAMEIAA